MQGEGLHLSRPHLELCPWGLKRSWSRSLNLSWGIQEIWGSSWGADQGSQLDSPQHAWLRHTLQWLLSVEICEAGSSEWSLPSPSEPSTKPKGGCSTQTCHASPLIFAWPSRRVPKVTDTERQSRFNQKHQLIMQQSSARPRKQPIQKMPWDYL